MHVMFSAVKLDKSYFLIKHPSVFFHIQRSLSYEHEMILSYSNPELMAIACTGSFHRLLETVEIF